MIGKASACIGGYSLFNYVMSDEKGYELIRSNLCGESPLEIMQEMKIIQDLNQNATNKLISMVLSPDINDGQKLSKKELREITKDFLKGLDINIEKEQFLAFVHTEKRHRHIHILLNRVQSNSRLIPDHHIGKKAQWSAHNIAIKHNLISAKQISIDKIKIAESVKKDSKNLRKNIYQKHLKVLASKPVSVEKYISNMQKLGVAFIPTINKQGNIQGFRIRDMETQVEMKASDVHRDMGLARLIQSGLRFGDENVTLHKSLQDAHLASHNRFELNDVEEKHTTTQKVNKMFNSPSINVTEYDDFERKRKRKSKR